MIADAITLIEFLKKYWEQYSVISALFDWKGQKIEGDERIAVERIIADGSENKWFYKIKELEEYVFIYMPVIPTVYVDYGMKIGEQNPNAKFFRFVGNIFSSVISGGNSNVKVDFIVVGYKPKDLLKTKKG